MLNAYRKQHVLLQITVPQPWWKRRHFWLAPLESHYSMLLTHWQIQGAERVAPSHSHIFPQTIVFPYGICRISIKVQKGHTKVNFELVWFGCGEHPVDIQINQGSLWTFVLLSRYLDGWMDGQIDGARLRSPDEVSMGDKEYLILHDTVGKLTIPLSI